MLKIGEVSDISLDPKSFESIVTIRIDAQYKSIPDDTTASVFTAGLLGEQYVSLEPGGSSDYLKEGSAIEITQSAIILEKAIGQFLFKSAEEKNEPIEDC